MGGEYLFLLFIVTVVMIGSAIVSSVARNRPGATDYSKTMAVGFYDLMIGLVLWLAAKSIPNDSKEAHTIREALNWIGIVWMVLGAFQIIISIFAGGMEQEINKKVEERFKQSEAEKIENKKNWICSCGYKNFEGRASCGMCGRKNPNLSADSKNQNVFERTKNAYQSVPTWKRMEMSKNREAWVCSTCGEQNEGSETCCKKCGMN